MADTPHETAAIGTDGAWPAGVLVCLCVAGGNVGLAGRLDVKQVAHARQGPGSVALGEKAVVTDAMEPVGQDVEEKAADELVRGKPHDAGAAAAIILVGERHVIVVDGDKPRIGDRRAMGVAGEIGQYALGATEGGLGVDDEGALPQRAHTFGERGDLSKRDQVAEETEFAATESGF
jgi:hypothetical protein